MKEFQWEPRAREIFDHMIEKTPVFLRTIAKDKVSKKVCHLVESNQRITITEKDVVDAFFAETPFGFHGPMKGDMDAIGVDYQKYGHT